MRARATPKAQPSPETLRARGWIMPGSIYRRGRSFVLKLYSGKAPGGGSRFKRITFRSRDAAEAAQRELASHTLAHAAGTGLYGSPRERLGPYVADWVHRAQSRLAPKTYRWYCAMADTVRADVLGTIPLARLTPRALEAYYARTLAQGASPTTVLHHHRLLHTALRTAERQDLILRNPAALAEAPRRQRPQLSVWSESETALFLSEARTHSPYYRLYLFLIGTGCRLGEALGLRWRDLDLRLAEVTIRHTLQRLQGGGFVLREPKTAHSRRTITLPGEVTQELYALRAAQQQTSGGRRICEREARCVEAHCPHWHALEFVFTQPNGKPLHDHNLRTYDLIPLCRRLGLPYQRAIHNLRHGHATSLLQRGISLKVVQERLGHGAAAFTLATYGHVLAGMQAQAAQAVSALLRACDSSATPSGNGDHAESREKTGEIKEYP
jgi:integrase